MSKFELSDKELKELLQSEVLDEPSMSFNRNVINQISVSEHAKSIKTPFALKALYFVIMITPLILVFMNGGIDLGLNLEKEYLTSINSGLDFRINEYYIYFAAILVGVIWLAILLNRVLTNQVRDVH